MKRFDELLTEYRTALGAASDYELAAKLNITRQYLSQIRNHGTASDALCLQIAETIGADPAEVLIARNAAKESGAVGEAWKAYAAKVAAMALLLGTQWIQAPYAKGEGEFFIENNDLPSLKITGNFGFSFIFKLLWLKLRGLFPVIQRTGPLFRWHPTVTHDPVRIQRACRPSPALKSPGPSSPVPALYTAK